jgi:hypothetical protein
LFGYPSAPELHQAEAAGFRFWLSRDIQKPARFLVDLVLRDHSCEILLMLMMLKRIKEAAPARPGSVTGATRSEQGEATSFTR